MDETRANETITCPSCGREWPSEAAFCGGCGLAFGGADAGTADGAETAPTPVEPEVQPEDAATVPVHHSPSGGIQSYLAPDAGAELGPFIEADRALDVVETRGSWARVESDGGEAGWVDGRRLVPPATTSVGPAATASIGAGAIVGAVAAVGVIVGAAVDWTSGGFGGNAFDIPLFPLFDYSNFDADPKVGYVLVACALVGLVCCFVRRAAWVRLAAGALALVPIVAYIVRIGDAYGGTDVTDVLGAGPWVAGISAIVLGLSPMSRR